MNWTNLSGRSILVTGGAGSFGRAFVKTVFERFDPARVVVFSRDEAKQHDMSLSYGPEYGHALRFFIGDVRDRDRLVMAMRGIDTVIHAAALKHVSAAEYNPFECIHTNVYGAENVVWAALNSGVERVIALSTDKAVSPINLYGASKLAADKIIVAANNLSGDIGTRFAVVRYGNVVGSRGSVVEIYRKLLAEGARELPVTDRRMTRFWITLQQGVDFVLSSIAMTKGGEIFIPRLSSLRIVDLASHMGNDVPMKIVGIRPGEKLHEELISRDDSRCTVEYPDRYVIEPSLAFWKVGHHEEQGATRVGEDFRYASDSNGQWLDGESLQRMLDETP